MYDNLDDAVPPSTPPGARERVSARAAQLRRRRMLVAGGSGIVLVVAAALLLLSLQGPGVQRSTLLITATSSPTPIATPIATPVPSFTAPATPVPSPTPVTRPSALPCPGGCGTMPTVPASSGPSPTSGSCADAGRGYDDCPDGKPGWSTGFLACQSAEQMADRPPTLPGLDAVLDVPASTSAGTATHGSLLFTNHSDTPLQFALTLPVDIGLEAVLVGQAGNSARHFTDVMQDTTIDLAPGQTRSLAVQVQTSACGDTQRDAEPGLPVGQYRAQVMLDVTAPASASGVWLLSSHVTLT
ncbi:MAG: hypothetical protein JWO12_2260 [Frankiales bacterium]|nr:hypothetical protein [Frankiales bacterium]